MEIITGTALSNKCDYSFGDHMGGWDPVHLPGGFMKHANFANEEFFEKCKEYEGKVMTLFIDNIRLYPRNIWADKEEDVPWLSQLLSNNNLLLLCRELTKNKFVIFTSHEDTPIDEHISIPDNVLGIHAVNAEFFGGKIHPFPYGLQREIQRNDGDYDDRVSVMQQEIDTRVEPTKLLYVNCGIGRHEDRKPLALLEGLDWCTCRFNKDSKFFPYSMYRKFLNDLRDHKFVVCPRGHGLDCHRNWETLYMRRVPVMKNHPYFHKLMEGFPVLWINDWSDVNKELFTSPEAHALFDVAQVMNMKKLDLNLMFDTIMANYKGNI